MKSRRLRYALCAIAGAAAVSIAAMLAHAQQGLPSDVYTAETISQAQRQAIEAYIDAHVTSLETGDPVEVKDGRRRLIESMRFPGRTDAFDEAYQSILSGRIVNAIGADDVVIRMNAMIVVSHLDQPEAIPLVVTGLQDQNPGVRYWASKAAQNVAEREGIDPQHQGQLLNALQNAIGREEDEKVLGGLLRAMVVLDIPQARDALINALDERIVIHVEHPNGMYEAERGAMNRLLHELIGAREQPGGGVEAETVRRFAQTGFRYTLLAARQNDSHNFPSDIRNDHANLIKLGEGILTFCVDNLAEGTRKPQSWEGAVRIQDWKFVLAQLEQWKNVLRRAPFNLKDEDLNVQADEQALAEQ